MRILLVHNQYRSAEPSGENHVVESEARELRERGHDVQVWGPSSDEIAEQSPVRKLLLPGRVVWSRESARAVATVLDEDRPDVVHILNTFPLISGSILRVLRERITKRSRAAASTPSHRSSTRSPSNASGSLTSTCMFMASAIVRSTSARSSSFTAGWPSMYVR